MGEFHWSKERFDDLASYVSEGRSFIVCGRKPRLAEFPDRKNDLIDFIAETMGMSFSDALLRMIDRKGMTDVEVYKAAKIDRRVFSKLRSSSSYQPSKSTAVRLCLALKAEPGEAMTLLEKAGLCLSRSKKEDLVVLYCLKNGIHEVDAVNEALEKLGLEKLD